MWFNQIFNPSLLLPCWPHLIFYKFYNKTLGSACQSSFCWKYCIFCHRVGFYSRVSKGLALPSLHGGSGSFPVRPGTPALLGDAEEVGPGGVCARAAPQSLPGLESLRRPQISWAQRRSPSFWFGFDQTPCCRSFINEHPLHQSVKCFLKSGLCG